MDSSFFIIDTLSHYCERCQGQDHLLFCTPCFRFGLCGHVSCQSCFKLANQTNESKSYVCPVCKGPFYYSLSSLEEAIMLGEGLYSFLRNLRREVEIGDSDPTKFLIEAQPLRNQYLNKFTQLIEIYPNSICGLISSISCLNSVITLIEYTLLPRPGDLDNGTLYCDLRPELTLNVNNMYKFCIKLLDMTDHESAFLITENLDVYYSCIAHAFSFNYNVFMAVKYYKMAYAFALRANHSSEHYKKQLTVEMKRLAVFPPLRFAIGDKVLCREVEGGEWRQCEVAELHYRERDDSLRYRAPYRVKVLAGDDSPSGNGGDEEEDAHVYITIEDDSDAYARRPGWISLEAARFEARLDAKVEELAQV